MTDFQDKNFGSCRSFFKRDNLVLEILTYCSCSDLTNLSLVNRRFRELVSRRDNQYKEIINNKFASKYESYNSVIIVDNGSILNCSTVPLTDEKVEASESVSPYGTTWKNMLSLANYIFSIWNCGMFDEWTKSDLNALKLFLYENLKSNGRIPSIRKKNKIIENEFNSPLQTFLYDYLFDTQSIYNFYETQFKTRESSTILPRGSEQVFEGLLKNASFIVDRIKRSPEQKEQLLKLRWYFCFNETNYRKNININDINMSDMNHSCFQNMPSEIEEKVQLSHSLINMLIMGEFNEIFFVLKCINLTVTSYCKFIMNYVYATYKNKKYDFIKEFNKRYLNFVNCAIEVDNYCENLNVLVNYAYNKIFPDYPENPKFSVFRLMMKIWFREFKANVSKHETMSSCFQMALTSAFSSFLKKDFAGIKGTLEKIRLKYSCENINYTNNLCLSTDSSTKASRLSEQGSSKSTMVKQNNALYEEDKMCYSLIENGLSIIYDSFCNEFSVYYINHSQLQTNEYYNEVSASMRDVLESAIREIFAECVLKQKISPSIVIDHIVTYLSCYFYKSRIINKLCREIYKTAFVTVKTIIMNELYKNFRAFLSEINSINEAQAIAYLSYNPNQYYKDEIYITFFKEFAKIIPNNKVRECVVMTFVRDYRKNDPWVLALKKINLWYGIEREIFEKKNKKIEKENEKRGIPFEVSKDYKALMALDNSLTFSQFLEVKKNIEEEEEDKTMMEIDEYLLANNAYDDLAIG